MIYVSTEYFGISNPKKVIALYVEDKWIKLSNVGENLHEDWGTILKG